MGFIERDFASAFCSYEFPPTDWETEEKSGIDQNKNF